jgi:dsDNA-binding SOS-regulon protein
MAQSERPRPKITLYMDDEVIQALKLYAVQNRTNVSAIMNKLASDFIAKQNSKNNQSSKDDENTE